MIRNIFSKVRINNDTNHVRVFSLVFTDIHKGVDDAPDNVDRGGESLAFPVRIDA